MIMTASSDATPRGLVVGNTVTNFKAGIATNLIASGMLLADNTLSSTFADIVVGDGPGTPFFVENGNFSLFDTPYCASSSVGNAVLAEAGDLLAGNLDDDSNIIVRRDELGAWSGAIEGRIAEIYARVARGGALHGVFEDLYATYEALFGLLEQAE